MLTRREILASPLALAQSRNTHLNVILILVDDWGASDLACYGSKFYETPNIDKLAASGMRFTQAYSACTVCSPSRAAVLTGKYPARLHITDWIGGHNYPFARLKPPDWTKHLPLEERTIAEALKPRGYTTASIGKWHLTPPAGDSIPNFYPEHQGFDLNRGGSHRGQPPSYFSPYGLETLDDGPKGEYLTDREQQEASKFIEANRSKPFFLYLPHYTVHTPIQAPEADIEYFRKKADPGAPQHNAAYAAMIKRLDDNIGQLMDTLERTGVADRTVVMLTGDNGGWLPSTNQNLGLRAGKGSVYEGGVRVPLIVRWPGVTKPGSTCDVPVIGADLHPTALEAGGAVREPGHAIDGVSLASLLRTGGSSRGWKREALFWHYPHYHPGGATPYSAIRFGNWKLIEFQEDGRVELFDLAKDLAEANDAASANPKIVANLRARLASWRKQVGAQQAVPNPDFDPQRASERPAARRPSAR